MSRWILLIVPALAWQLGCEPREGGGSRLDNRPPQTHLSVGFFRADSAQVDTLGLSTSRVGLAWWGEDADGWIDHYLYRWSSDVDSAGNPVWHRTEAESDTFVVLLTQDVELVRFEIRAVDNEGAVDPSPAVTVFPAYNQKPRVDWVAQSQELLSNTTADTSWTFGFNTFHFNAWDLDGNATITRVVWALDDTSSWQDLPPGLGSISLTPAQLTPGPHRVFVKAQDIAQAWSETLGYPRPGDTLADGRAQVWAVRPLEGHLLVVFDDPAEVTEGVPYVRAGLDAMGYQEHEDFTFWVATNWLPYDDQDFQAIMDDFAMVFWFSWKRTQNELACDNLDLFMARGGRLLMTTTDIGRRRSTGGTYIFDGICVPVDSLTDQRDRILPSHPLLPGAGFAHYPSLAMREAISFVSPGSEYPRHGFLPDSSATELYFVPEVQGNPDRPRVTVAARVEADGRPGKAKQLYFALPLHKATNLDSLFMTVIHDDFNW
ncbi:MAG: hypothetical protein Q8O14_15035 [bacterium]|jgi:hypothetical protein|nr:hypothetical protein [bacterium]